MKKKTKKLKNIQIDSFKSIISAVAVAYLLYIFTFYVDGEMGIILIAFLVSAPIISLILATGAVKRIKVSIDCDGYVNKDSVLNLKVDVEKSGLFPIAIAEVNITASEVFDCFSKSYRLSILGEEKKSFEVPIRAVVGGNGEVSVESVYSCGFLGFIKFRVKNIDPLSENVGVIPEIPEIKTSSQLFRNIADVVMTSDDEEDNDTAMLFSMNTSPGYEHREYVQGDPLKRVNWKLSSKRNTLMVRLDESASSVQPVIVLDLFRKSDGEVREAVQNEERLLQSVFGLVNALVRQGIACGFVYYGSGGEMVSESVDNPDYPAQLLLKVLAVKVVPDKRVSLNMVNESVCACIIATTDCGEGIETVTQQIHDPDNVSLMGTSQDMKNLTNFPLWYLDGDNNFKIV